LFLNVGVGAEFRVRASRFPISATQNEVVSTATTTTRSNRARRTRRVVGLGRAVLAVALVGAGIIAAGCGGDQTAAIKGVQRTPLLEVGSVSLPEVTTDDAGTPFTFKAAPGGLLVVYFGFTNCPDLCPTTLADLRAARKRIGPDADVVDLAFATVDPERDTIEIMRKYAGSFAERYHVLRTTDPAVLKTAEDAFLASSSVTKLADGEVSVTHTATAYVVDSNGTVLVEWPFGIGANGMENDLRILIKQLKENN